METAQLISLAPKKMTGGISPPVSILICLKVANKDAPFFGYYALLMLAALENLVGG
jgi:hypothetical protein